MRRIVYYNASKPAFRPFIIQVNSGADSQFTIPTAGGGYNYSVNTSDGQTFNGVTGNLTITFPSANTLYDVSISGSFPRIYFNNGTQRLKIVDIKQWGDIGWTSMQSAFYGCSNMTCTATDVPNVSSVTAMSSMFYNASAFNSDLSTWNVSNVTNMSGVFRGASALNSDLSNWDVSSVTDMTAMFYNASAFNSDLSTWNVSNVTNMINMFLGASAFNSDLSNWNVSSVTTMQQMFFSGGYPTGISNWDMSSVQNVIQMFWANPRFNIANGNNVIKLNTSNALTQLNRVIGGQSPYTNGVTDFEVTDCSNVTDMTLAFNGASGLERLILNLITVSFDIRYSPNLNGLAIDDLANSVADLTGFTTQNITMTLAQRASCNQALWTNKNWTIIAI